ncbi:hypothetical protein [Acinetobacter sp. 18QD2AZ41W]|uniref:hypothetical protein n=1 Tax=Acinetobacter sp. 18QD2AZ41W TaxID=2692137 RepID=UPI0013579593|nr:hypothetical protein [Acinetobacter sp. 18QD2AZ41W]
MELEDKLKLNPGEKLVLVDHKMKGSLQEMDINKYNILNQKEAIVGYVDHTDHTAPKGFKRTQTAKHYDADKKLIMNITW